MLAYVCCKCNMFLKQHRIGMKMEEIRQEKKYTESLFYEVYLTGKYIKKLSAQHFKNLNLELTGEEFSTLDFIYHNGNMCQRDLALKMFINRANMGKILNELENKGYLKRFVDVKCNRPVKLISMTKEGEEVYTKTLITLRNTAQKAYCKFKEDEVKVLIAGMQKLREYLKEIVEIDI